MRKVVILLILLLVTGCSANTTYIEPIKLNCKDISVMQFDDFKLEDYCEIPAQSSLTLQGEINTEEIGTHTLSYILSSKDKNDFTMGSIDYEVTKYLPVCPENTTYTEDEEGNGYCACNEGYVNRTPEENKQNPEKTVCELKAVCEAGYYYVESTNSCAKKQSKPASNTPSVSSTPSASSVPSSLAPEPVVQPEPQPQQSSGGGSAVCSPQGNSQSALDNAYSQCVSICNSHATCSVDWNGSSYVATWE